MADMLRQQLLDTSRGRIVTLLRTGGLTADDIATKLGLTPSAVRIQISAMERDGVVRIAGMRPGTTRPSYVFALTPEVEQLLSKAYIPLLIRLVGVFVEALPADQVEKLLRLTGKALARDLSGGKRLTGTARTRAERACEMLNEAFGAATKVDGDGTVVIRGAGCPLAALTGKHQGACLAMESLVSEIVGSPVRECCDRDEQPRCRFEVS